MKRYIINIKLLSDMCVSDGGVYNSAIDMDVCYDEYGFPYIPAKRIKGCLRECAIELKDMGLDINVIKLFGDKKDKAAGVRLGNAYLKDYERMHQIAVANSKALIFHPQNILNTYTYVRTQTSIDYSTGVADDGSLRTMRVIKKGYEFCAEVILKDEDKNNFEKCCNILTHMGVARTRGLGEVLVSLCEDVSNQENDNKLVCNGLSSGNRLDYAIYLHEPVICKSINGGEAHTLDYIEGSKILGLIGQRLKEENGDFGEWINKGDLFCSNAYIDYNGKRCVEVPATYYSVKNEKLYYVDKLHKETGKETELLKDKQLNSMKHCYVSFDEEDKLVRMDVDTEERYHHSRPEDKSIGRVKEGTGDESQLYQMASICAGQIFRGFITGSKEQIEDAVRLLKKDKNAYIGFSRNSEYGKVSIVECTLSESDNKELTSCDEFFVKLESPTIIYSDKATYSTNSNDLIAEVNASLKLESDQWVVDKYINYTTVGGFNVTWGMRKPTIDVFDKGTVLHYKKKNSESVASCNNIEFPSSIHIGERGKEGYGEVTISKVDKDTPSVCYMSENTVCQDKKDNATAVVCEEGFVRTICDRLFVEYIRMDAIKKAKEYPIGKNDIRPTVSNMLLMCKETDSLDKIKAMIKDRYEDKETDKKQEKSKIAEEFVRIAKDNVNISKNDNEVQAGIIADFEKHYGVASYNYDGDIEKLYLEVYLNELKYRLRIDSSEKNSSKEGV